MIEINEISKIYDNQCGSIAALKDVSFTVEKGSFACIVGESGCGKTTLLKIISGIIEPSAGRVVIDGKNQRENMLRRSVGVVFQEPTLLPWRTVLRNIQLPLEIIPENSFPSGMHDLLTLMKLSRFENAFPYQLSAGMKTRVAIARALIFNPEILLMDEPFNNLDELNRDIVNLELLRIWKKTGATVIFVTHNISEAVFLADKILVLTARPGQVKAVMEVNLPRPRNFAVRRLPEFVQKVEDIKTLLMPLSGNS